jgi:hypothetical protein
MFLSCQLFFHYSLSFVKSMQEHGFYHYHETKQLIFVLSNAASAYKLFVHSVRCNRKLRTRHEEPFRYRCILKLIPFKLFYLPGKGSGLHAHDRKKIKYWMEFTNLVMKCCKINVFSSFIANDKCCSFTLLILRNKWKKKKVISVWMTLCPSKCKLWVYMLMSK